MSIARQINTSLDFSKDAILERIRANRDAHRSVYEQAMAGYREAAITWFNDQMDAAVQGKHFSTYWGEPMPEDHTADYDVVIDMLELTSSTEITLTQAEFRQYMRDEWSWKREWMATASNYTQVQA